MTNDNERTMPSTNRTTTMTTTPSIGEATRVSARRALPLLVAAALGLAACQSVPTREPSIVQAQQAYDSAANDPRIARTAQTELREARDALARADAAWQQNHNVEEARHLAYLAEQRARIAAEVGNRRAAEESLQQASTERDRVRLQARERETQLQRERALEAQQRAQLEAARAAAAQNQAQQALSAADRERQQAQMASQQAQAAMSAVERERQRAAQLQNELRELSAKNTDRGLVVTLSDVLFDTGKAELRTGAMRAVDRLAEVLKQYEERRVSIEGFTDSTGSDDYNMALSERRANAVRQALVSRGVPPNRIMVRPYGEAYPVATNDTAAGRQMNRRVEIVLSDSQGNVRGR